MDLYANPDVIMRQQMRMMSDARGAIQEQGLDQGSVHDSAMFNMIPAASGASYGARQPNLEAGRVTRPGAAPS